MADSEQEQRTDHRERAGPIERLLRDCERVDPFELEDRRERLRSHEANDTKGDSNNERAAEVLD